jgi:uncharacterized protein YaeQ
VTLTATIHHFAIGLCDVDRGVYETLALKVARHPSEAEDHLVTRVLAYCLELTEGLNFSRGLSEPDEPALSVRDLTGRLRAWIDVGAPDAARLHRASKAAPRVAVYTHKSPAQLLRQLGGVRIHQRRMQFDLSVTDRHLFVSIRGATLSGAVERLALAA